MKHILVYISVFCLLTQQHLHAQTRTKADFDGNGLIEIRTLTELNNIRYNLAGTGLRTTALGQGQTTVSHPGLTTGCPNKDHDSSDSTAKQPTCHGYELVADLDFRDTQATGYSLDWVPTTGSGPSRTVVAPASGTNSGWVPIGDNTNVFSGIFDGHHHTIANLYVNLASTADNTDIYAGLFGYVGGSSRLRNLGLTGEHMAVRASATHDGSAAHAGGLAGYAGGASTNCYATGRVTATAPTASKARAGGLAGQVRMDPTAGYYSGVVKKATSSGGLSSAPAIQTAGKYKTPDQLKALTVATSATRERDRWSTDNWVFVSGKLPSLKLCGQSSDHVQCPAAPTLAQKASALTHAAQTYTATFTGGTLYYLLRSGEKDDNVSAANIKDGTNAVGGNKGSVLLSAEPKEVSLTGLSSGTEYTLYAFVEASDEKKSSLATQTFTTLTATGQVYTATFSGGTLWYLLRSGAKDDEVTAANVKAGANAVGTNKGSVLLSAEPKEIALSGLSSDTEYTLYAFVEATSGGLQSGVATQTFTTKGFSGGISTPSYSVGTATETTIPLAGVRGLRMEQTGVGSS